MPSQSFYDAKENIRCDCPQCLCPASGKFQYSFCYVDEVRKCIYYDVPKAASTTIRKKLGIGKLPHYTSLTDPELPYENYFQFSIVRNPWDRMLSNWKMFTTRPNRMKQLRSMTELNLSQFSQFVEFAVRTPNHHWQPQSLFVPENIDYVGRLEKFEEALKFISNNVPNFDPLNIAHNASKLKPQGSENGLKSAKTVHRRSLIPRKFFLKLSSAYTSMTKNNIGQQTNSKIDKITDLRNGTYQSSYSTKDVKIVSDFYSEDIERFGYEF